MTSLESQGDPPGSNPAECSSGSAAVFLQEPDTVSKEEDYYPYNNFYKRVRTPLTDPVPPIFNTTSYCRRRRARPSARKDHASRIPVLQDEAFVPAKLQTPSL